MVRWAGTELSTAFWPALVLAAGLTGSGGLHVAAAQTPPKSQLGTVSQLISGTRVDVVYRRPVARGRALFGALVPWGRIWTPSADSAVRITLSAPMAINGATLAAGTYGIWTIPDSVSWTIIFNRRAEAFHLRYPDGQDVLRVRATPTRGDHVETLQWEFPMVLSLIHI